ncbi:hypothetical protein Tco_0532608 [Tanacetum coccineum]
MDYASGGRLRKISAKKAWATIEELARYEDEGWNDPVAREKGASTTKTPTLNRRSESVFGMTSNTMYQLPSEPSRQEEFEDFVMNFILNQEEKFRQLEEYMCVIRSDFMQLSLEVVGKLKEEIRIEQNRTKKIKKITSPPLVRESTFGFKPGINNNRNIKSQNDAENLSPQSSPQILPSFEVYTPPVTYPDEVEEIIGIPIEVEPLEETQLEDLGLNTFNHNIPLSSREVPSFDKPELQPQSFPNYPPLDTNNLTIHTPPSSLVASFHLRDLHCYYRPCINDPKKHYGFKPGLLGHSGSLGVDFSKLGMIEDDWKLESKEFSFLGRRLNSPVRPKEVEKVRIKETHQLEHKIQQILFQHMAPSRHHGVYHYYHPHLNLSIEEEVYVCQPPGFEDPDFSDRVIFDEKKLESS